jgi:hypothetical protein
LGVLYIGTGNTTAQSEDGCSFCPLLVLNAQLVWNVWELRWFIGRGETGRTQWSGLEKTTVRAQNSVPARLVSNSKE